MRWRTPTFRAALASDRKISPLEVGLSKPPMPVVAGAPMGTGAVIWVPFCTNFSIHDICTILKRKTYNNLANCSAKKQDLITKCWISSNENL
jgi:hypothetical protein